MQEEQSNLGAKGDSDGGGIRREQKAKAVGKEKQKTRAKANRLGRASRARARAAKSRNEAHVTCRMAPIHEGDDKGWQRNKSPHRHLRAPCFAQSAFRLGRKLKTTKENHDHGSEEPGKMIRRRKEKEILSPAPAAFFRVRGGRSMGN